MKLFSFFAALLLTAELLMGQVIHVPADYPTILEAVNAADSGDTVLVDPGVYHENFNFYEKTITLASLYLTTQNPAYISQTVIEGGSNGSVIQFVSVDTSFLLCGFTLINGWAYSWWGVGSGGGIKCVQSSPRIEHVVITDNYGNNRGGGIACESMSSPVLHAVTISNNIASSGGGISCVDNSTVVFDSVERSNIYFNLANTGNDIYSDSALNVIVDTFTVLLPYEELASPLNFFTFNILHGKIQQQYADLFVSPSGDNNNDGLTPQTPLKNIEYALYAVMTDSLNPRIIHLLEGVYSFSTNEEKFPLRMRDYINLVGAADTLVTLDAGSSTTVISIWNDKSVHLNGMTIQGGNALGNQTGSVQGVGGGIQCFNSDPVLEHLIVKNNEANFGGGLYFQDSHPVVEHVTIMNNNAMEKGAGLCCSNSEMSMKDCEILNNNVSFNPNVNTNSGGGIVCDNSNIDLENVTIANNSATRGGGLYVSIGNITFDSLHRCNIYSNNGSLGQDLNSDIALDVIVDTFTVLQPTNYHALPLSNFTFNILHGKVPQVDADLFVSPAGDNSNDGLSALTPLKNIEYAFERIFSDSANIHTVHLLNGVYSATSNQEIFPLHLFSYLHISGTGDSLVILDAENTSSVIVLDRDSAVEIKGLAITGGSAMNGGGIYIANSTAALKDLSIHDNIAFNGGGGIYCFASNTNMENVSFRDNSSQLGGGLCSLISDNTINHGSFISNLADANGGGLYSEQSGNFLKNSVFRENHAYYGGGLSLVYDSCILQNVSVTRNVAGSTAGGIYISEKPPVFSTANRCNIYLNEAPNGADLYQPYYYAGYLDVIVDTFTLLHPNNYLADPIPYYTFDILHGKIETVNADLYVSPDGNNENSGLTASEPLKNISIAVPKLFNDSLSPRTIHLMKGTYSRESNKEAFPVEIPPYVSLKGVSADSVILQGNGTSLVLSIMDNPSATISGMTIRGGQSYYGGGIHCKNSSPLLQDLVVRDNVAINFGGGMFCYSASPLLKNVRFSHNTSKNGGGMFIRYSDPYLQDVTADSCTATMNGGGICCFNSSPIFRNLRLHDNYSSIGGGMALAVSNVTIQNALISGNTGYNVGGGIFFESATCNIMQMTLTGNKANNGGGIYSWGDNTMTIVNSILWNDSLHEVSGPSITIEYSNVEGGYAGQGNISQDPLFAGTSPEPYSLSFGSPCIDAGTPDPQWLSLPPWDILGNQRIWDGDGDGNATVDMGAYEYGATLVGVPSNNNKINSRINCYPNPFVNQAVISYSLTESCHVKMRVLNQLGQVVEVLEDAFQTQGNKTISLDAEHYPGGLYYLHLLAGDKVSALKIVK